MLEKLILMKSNDVSRRVHPGRLLSNSTLQRLLEILRLGSYYSPSSLVESEFLLEVFGELGCLWRLLPSNHPRPALRSGPFDLTHSSLAPALTEVKYFGQGITVILHAANVSTKCFRVERQSVHRFVRDNLDAIFPPGDRNAMMLRYGSFNESTLITSITSREQSDTIQKLLFGTGARVRRILPAALLVAGLHPEGEDTSHATFGLAEYDCQRTEGILHVKPLKRITSENRTHSECLPSHEGPPEYLVHSGLRFITESELHKLIRSLDFLPASRHVLTQWKERLIGKSFVMSVRIAAALLILLLGSSLFRVGYQALYDSNGARVRNYEVALTEAESTNAKLVAKLAAMQKNPQLKDGTIPRIMSLISNYITMNHWLEQFTISRPEVERSSSTSFKFTGYSLDPAKLLNEVASLQGSEIVYDASIVQSAKIPRPSALSEIVVQDEINHFEVYGETR